MRVLLIAPDSKIPNLAIMKISTYHKGRGDSVSRNENDPELIYISIIFDWNRGLYQSIKALYPGKIVVVGGPGYDPTIKLSPEIERCRPDHTVYPDSKYSIGRVTSGCIRKCHFCMVHKLEPGGIRYIQSPAEIWKPGTILRLIDDNILAMPGAFAEIYWFCKANDVTIRFEYLDCRLITEHIAVLLKDMKHDGQIHFAFDITSDEPLIRRGIRRMKIAGHRPNNLQFLLYLHDEKSIPDAKYRWDVIRGEGCEPFLMVNRENRTERLRKIQRRGCRPAIWRNMKTEVLFECATR